MKKNTKINEATGTGSAGHYKVPIVLAPQIWKKDQLGPFTEPVYKYTNAELAYEEADGDYLESPERRHEIENKTEKLSQVDMYLKQFYTGQNDEDGSNIANLESPEKMVTSVQGPLDESFLKEDLAVWFGTKKKPKGSKQPKGPWVNICRKVNGKHPPCGRPEAKSKGYPKCRAAGVASKMSDSQKRSACSQKRAAEKKDPKIGTGNKPTMTSYKPRKESISRLVNKVLKEVYESSNYNPEKLYLVEKIYKATKGAPDYIREMVVDLDAIPCKNKEGIRKMCYRLPEFLYMYFSERNLL